MYLKENLLEVLPFHYELVEDKSTSGKPTKKVVGTFQVAEVKNANGRIYPKKLWERVINDPGVQQKIKNRELYGELDHPDDGQTKLKRVSHVITELRMDGNQIIGVAEILPTPHGQILSGLFDAKTSPGISSRGKGSVRNEAAGSVVCDDYDFMTFDFVSGPSAPGAYPKPMNENSNSGIFGGNIKMSLADLKVIKENVELSVKSLASLQGPDRERLFSKLTEAEVEINKIVQTEPALADFGQEIKDLIKKAKTENVNEVSDKEKLAAAIVIIEKAKENLKSLQESYAKDIEASQKIVKELVEKLASLQEEAKKNKFEEKYETVCELGDELAKRADKFRRKYEAACKIGDELLERAKDYSIKYEAACKIGETLLDERNKLQEEKDAHLTLINEMVKKSKAGKKAEPKKEEKKEEKKESIQDRKDAQQKNLTEKAALPGDAKAKLDESKGKKAADKPAAKAPKVSAPSFFKKAMGRVGK